MKPARKAKPFKPGQPKLNVGDSLRLRERGYGSLDELEKRLAVLDRKCPICGGGHPACCCAQDGHGG